MSGDGQDFESWLTGRTPQDKDADAGGETPAPGESPPPPDPASAAPPSAPPPPPGASAPGTVPAPPTTSASPPPPPPPSGPASPPPSSDPAQTGPDPTRPDPTEAVPASEGATEVLDPPGEASAIDDLFGEAKFQEYEDRIVPPETPFASTKAKEPKASKPEGAPRAPRSAQGGLPRLQQVLLWIAGGLLAALALLALFVLGTKLPDLLGPAPAILVSNTPTPTPTPTDAAEPVGPVEPGDYEWDELLGGECLDPYPGPWADDYTVVDCAEPHPAQLVARGPFPDEDAPFPPYPGLEVMQAQINLLCTAPKVIDYAAAGTYLDVQFEASYPATQEEWAEGHRDYFCFVSRSSGESITGSVAVPPPTSKP